MDKVTKYKKTIPQLFKTFAEKSKPSQKDAILQLAMDDETGQYLMVHNVWLLSAFEYLE